MKKYLVLLLTVAMVLSMFAGCTGSPAAPAEEPAAGEAATAAPEAAAEATPERAMKDELRIAMRQGPTNLDIVLNTADVSVEIVGGSVFEQLMAADANGAPKPELCTSCDVNDDSTIYTYHLRQGVKFHNGEEMKAADVVASMNRWIDNASAVQSMVGEARFYAVDDYTVEIKLAVGCPYLNMMIVGFGQCPAIMPASVIESCDPETGLVKEYIGTGPYKYDEWVTDQYVKITRFDDYTPYGTDGDFSGKVGYKNAFIKDVYFDIVTDASTLASGMQTGEYDATYDLALENYELFKNNPDFHTELSPSEMPALIFNKAKGLAADAKFRQGIAAILNADDIMYAAYGNKDFYELYSSYMYKNQTTWYTEAGSEYFNQANPERGKQLLTEAGYDFTTPFVLLVASDSADFYAMAQVVQQQLIDAGVPCDLLLYDWSTFVNIRNNEPDKYNAFITSFSSKPVPTMNLFLSSTWAGWCTDERIVTDLAAINTSTNIDDAVKIWDSLQGYMWAESMPVVKFGNQCAYMTYGTNVEGLQYYQGIYMSYVNAKIYEK